MFDVEEEEVASGIVRVVTTWVTSLEKNLTSFCIVVDQHMLNGGEEITYSPQGKYMLCILDSNILWDALEIKDK